MTSGNSTGEQKMEGGPPGCFPVSPVAHQNRGGRPAIPSAFSKDKEANARTKKI